jgi:uncharacterized protein
VERSVIAITGASSGIGEAFARRLAPGHDLLLIARREDRLNALADEFANKFGTRTDVLQADLTQEDDLNKVAARLESDARLSLLVNNAGFGTRGRFWETDLASQEQMHKLHVMATVRLTHAALRNMTKADFGAIINVASVSAFIRSNGATSYSATKAWMTAFTEGLHVELRSVRSSVVVQALCPGFTYSEFHDVMHIDRPQMAGSGWWATADDVVDASLEGLERRKLFVVPGWRYKVLTAIISKLPLPARIAVEMASPRVKARQSPVRLDARKQLEGKD